MFNGMYYIHNACIKNVFSTVQLIYHPQFVRVNLLFIHKIVKYTRNGPREMVEDIFWYGNNKVFQEIGSSKLGPHVII